MNGIATWIWRGLILVVIGVGWFYWTDMHDRVYSQIPDEYVHEDRFEDVCTRLDRIETKVDNINEYLRDRNP